MLCDSVVIFLSALDSSDCQITQNIVALTITLLNLGIETFLSGIQVPQGCIFEQTSTVLMQYGFSNQCALLLLSLMYFQLSE